MQNKDQQKKYIENNFSLQSLNKNSRNVVVSRGKNGNNNNIDNSNKTNNNNNKIMII